jgi:cysteinyl-tRNA synthetase
MKARAEKDWEEADRLREDIESRGWMVQDTSDGYHLENTNT